MKLNKEQSSDSQKYLTADDKKMLMKEYDLSPQRISLIIKGKRPITEDFILSALTMVNIRKEQRAEFKKKLKKLAA